MNPTSAIEDLEAAHTSQTDAEQHVESLNVPLPDDNVLRAGYFSLWVVKIYLTPIVLMGVEIVAVLILVKGEFQPERTGKFGCWVDMTVDRVKYSFNETMSALHLRVKRIGLTTTYARIVDNGTADKIDKGNGNAITAQVK
ncbi:hypothetical protein E1B28_001770 [Marasmius oreades]|uniref:Uncharacterized protein n=1 Tax=Marasmius oreades TaxID=181124 RepID=A0A9P7V4A6_9AGAR|nr:uncharacterized protein E1B28_001770 [Marasmius oreades]KAG7099977.1 hypothetical protein E1B28_001770 [Marasmius oreades]